MTTVLNAVHLRHQRRRDRVLSAGMGHPDVVMPAGTSMADPASLAQRSGSITIVSRIVHDGVPEGLLFSIGAANKGLIGGFDSATGTAQFLFRTSVAAGSIIDLALDDTTPSALSAGEHTYVFTIKAGSTGYSGALYVDGLLRDIGTSDNTNTWSTGIAADWFHALTNAGGVNGYTLSTTGLTDALPTGNLQFFYDASPAVVGV